MVTGGTTGTTLVAAGVELGVERPAGCARSGCRRAKMLAQILLRVVPLIACAFLASMGSLISDVTRAITVYNTASVSERRLLLPQRRNLPYLPLMMRLCCACRRRCCCL